MNRYSGIILSRVGRIVKQLLICEKRVAGYYAKSARVDGGIPPRKAIVADHVPQCQRSTTIPCRIERLSTRHNNAINVTSIQRLPCDAPNYVQDGDWHV